MISLLNQTQEILGVAFAAIFFRDSEPSCPLTGPRPDLRVISEECMTVKRELLWVYTGDIGNTSKSVVPYDRRMSKEGLPYFEENSSATFPQRARPVSPWMLTTISQNVL